MTSILEESKKAKNHSGFFSKKIKTILIIIILVAVASVSFIYFSKNKNSENASEVTTKSWSVDYDDLMLSVESDGKVVAEDGVELSFSVSGDTLEVLDVLVEEGQEIKKGDEIASVKTETLELNLQNSYASYQSALANYNEKVSGPTDDEIEDKENSISQAEISLEQSKISLEKTETSAKEKIRKAEAALEDASDNLISNENEANSEDVEEAYEDLVNVIKPIIMNIENILIESDSILGIDESAEIPALSLVLGAKDRTDLNNAKNSYNSVKTLQDNLSYYNLNLYEDSEYTVIDEAYNLTKETLGSLESHLYYLQQTLEATVTSKDITQNILDGYKNEITNNRNTVISKITSLNNSYRLVENAKDRLDDYVSDYEDALEDLETAKADAKNDIATAESNVESRELSLKQANSSYDSLFDDISASDLASVKSQLTSATVSLNKARLELDKATLSSPIDGEVALLNYKAGDIILTSENKPMAVILNDDTLFVEVNVEESDVSKLEVGQKVYVTFDSLDELKLEGAVSFISLTSSTSNNGIVTYLVKVAFDKGEYQIREGMTAYVDFVVSEASNVLVVPVSAIKNVNGSPSVKLENNEWKEISSGFTDGKYVEIIGGLEQGDKIIY